MPLGDDCRRNKDIAHEPRTPFKKNQIKYHSVSHICGSFLGFRFDTGSEPPEFGSGKCKFFVELWNFVQNRMFFMVL